MQFLLEFHYISLNRLAKSHTSRPDDWRLREYCGRCPCSCHLSDHVWDINHDSILNPIKTFRNCIIQYQRYLSISRRLFENSKAIFDVFWPVTRNMSHIRIMLQYIDFVVLYNVWQENLLPWSLQQQCRIYAGWCTVDSCTAYSTDLESKPLWLVLHSKAINANHAVSCSRFDVIIEIPVVLLLSLGSQPPCSFSSSGSTHPFTLITRVSTCTKFAFTDSFTQSYRRWESDLCLLRSLTG